MSEKRSGRPKVPSEVKLSKVLAVRLSDGFYGRVKKAARRAGMRPGVLVRKLVEEGQVVVRRVPEANMAAVGALARVGVNLNQLLRLVRQGAVGVCEPDLVEVIQELMALRKKLLGMDRPAPLTGTPPAAKGQWSIHSIEGLDKSGDEGGEAG